MSIEVLDQNGVKFIRKDGLTQSMIPCPKGGYWEQMIPEDFTPRTALILGLGAGTVCKVLRERFANIGLHVVDSNKQMIDIAKAVKAIDEFDRVTEGDAFDFIHEYEGMKFDLIIVDLFDGMNFNMRVITDAFLNDCKARVSVGGYLVVNVPNLSQCENHFHEAKRNDVQNIYFYREGV